MAKLIAGPAVAGVIIKSLIKIGKESEKAFQVQEKAVIGVTAALKATGQFTASASQDMQDYASSLQELTVVGDETTLSLIQTAINMGLTADEAKKATKQAIGMSEAYGVGLDTALRGTANATLGNFDALTRYLPAIKTATTDAEKAAIVQNQLSAAFDIATANATTSAGVQTQLSNSYGDLLETIGSVISEGMTPFRAELKKEVESVNQSIKAHILRKKALAGNATLVEELTLKQYEQEKAEEAYLQAKNNLIHAENKEATVIKGNEALSLRLQAARAAAIEQGKETLAVLQQELIQSQRNVSVAAMALDQENAKIDANIRLTQGMQEVNVATSENTALVDANNEAVKELIQTEQTFYNTFSGYSEEQLLHIYNTINAREGAAAAQEAENQKMEEYSQLLQDAKLNATELATTGLGSMVSGFEEVGKAIIEGGLSFKTFGKLALTTLADVLSSMGAQLAAQAALLFFGLIPDVGRGAGALAASAAAYTGAGVARAAAGSFEDGGIVPGTSYTGDNMLANVNSGEMVLNKGQQQNLFNQLQGGGGGMNNSRFTLVLDNGTELFGSIQQEFDNGGLRVPQRNVV
ncbi:MAG: hypothetical protein GY797_36980 [Deltaproteobacteria bacterium]|nr:hypothetical protein [Deltaproteobacteria bacterium]